MASKLNRATESLQKLIQQTEGKDGTRDLSHQSARLLAIFKNAKTTDENEKNLRQLTIQIDRYASSDLTVQSPKVATQVEVITSVFKRLADLLDQEALEDGLHPLHALDTQTEEQEFHELMGNLVSAAARNTCSYVSCCTDHL